MKGLLLLLFISTITCHDWSKGYPVDFTRRNLRNKSQENYQNEVGRMRKMIYENMQDNPDGQMFQTACDDQQHLFNVALAEAKAVEVIDCFTIFPRISIMTSVYRTCYRVKK